MILVIPVGRSTSRTATTPGVDMTARDLVRESMLEIGVLNPTEQPSGDDGDYVLSKLNRMLDRWNATPGADFSSSLSPLTLTPSLSPHTIGPSGTFTLAVRPMRIDAANLLIGTVRTPIAVRDQQWYQRLSVPEQTSEMPTDVYYEPAMPNGKLRFFPVPTAASAIELWTKGFFAAMTFNDRLVAPQGYRDAIVKTLAMECVAPFRVPMPSDLPRQAREAQSVCWFNNETIPNLNTRDAGMPGGCGGTYNYLTGLVE